MIDHFALGLSHGLLLLAAWRLLSRPDLEDDEAPAPTGPKTSTLWGARPGKKGTGDGA